MSQLLIQKTCTNKLHFVIEKCMSSKYLAKAKGVPKKQNIKHVMMLFQYRYFSQQRIAKFLTYSFFLSQMILLFTDTNECF